MLLLLLVLAAGFVSGLVTAVFIDTGIRLNEREGSAWVERWVKFRVFILYLWERKMVYLLLTGICLLAGLLIGSLLFLPGVEEGRPGGGDWWSALVRRAVR